VKIILPEGMTAGEATVVVVSAMRERERIRHARKHMAARRRAIIKTAKQIAREEHTS